MRPIIALIILLVVAPAAAAERQPTAWKGHEALAGAISDALVNVNVAAETIASLRAEQKWPALRCQALRMGIAIGANQAVKHLAHRVRPDGSNDLSFYSGHATTAAVASGWNKPAGLSIAFAVGLGRAAANKHYWSDIAVGWGAGLLARQVCR